MRRERSVKQQEAVFSRVLSGTTRFRTELRVAEIIHRRIRWSGDRAEMKVKRAFEEAMDDTGYALGELATCPHVRASIRNRKYHTPGELFARCFVGVSATKATNALGLAEIFRLFRDKERENSPRFILAGNCYLFVDG